MTIAMSTKFTPIKSSKMKMIQFLSIALVSVSKMPIN